MTVTLQEQWSISFEMRMTSAFGRGHHNFVNTKAGRYPGIYDPDQADPPSGFCCSDGEGGPTSSSPTWGSSLVGEVLLIEFKRTRQANGEYLSEYLVNGEVKASDTSSTIGIGGQVTTFCGRYSHQTPKAVMRNLDVYYYAG